MQTLIEKAAVLHEALPYIRRFRGCTFVIKHGGSAMVQSDLGETFAQDVVLMHAVGIRPVLVHGGGPQIDKALAAAGVVTRREQGLRVTDDATMAVVERVLRGEINREIVERLVAQGGRAVGLGGADDRLVHAKKLAPITGADGKPVDLGRVGEVVEARVAHVREAVSEGLIPVIAPLGWDEDGRALNINADTVAGAIAGALRAEKLVLMTDTDGVRDAGGTLIPSLTPPEIARLRADGVIAGGMIPKVECALAALSQGVGKCHIIDGRQRHAILLEIFTDKGVGTEIVT
jgi:acetylglutamate kinase